MIPIIKSFNILVFLFIFMESFGQTFLGSDETENKKSYSISNKCHQQALVVYDEEKVPKLHKLEREFVFNGQKLRIKQKWSEMGVAGAVWDSVFEIDKQFIQFCR